MPTKTHAVVPHPAFQLAAIWKVLLRRRRLTIRRCYVTRVALPFIAASSPRLLPICYLFFTGVCAPLLLFAPFLHKKMQPVEQKWAWSGTFCSSGDGEEMGLTEKNLARTVRLRVQTHKMWRKNLFPPTLLSWYLTGMVG